MADNEYSIRQGNSYIVEFQLKDGTGADLALTAIGTVLLTVYYYNPTLRSKDAYHLATINNRYQQSVKNQNNVTISSAGFLSWDMRPEDSPKLDSNSDVELHVAHFTWQYNSGKQNDMELYLWTQAVSHAV